MAVKQVETFLYFSIALGDSSDTSHTAHLLVFIQGVNGSQRITHHEVFEKQTTFETCTQHISCSQNNII